ncbi:MAG: peptidase M50 [uncultured bacterium (gcode 4)]|uniref:Peptidase M50 n=1 Tax=uncultured bacterium (gcode 4) TaxID=1234023 RepID=K1X597_9BACT|nr:MAG: peptidase M50 [uncultured bacterium (gcode 4)]
MWIFDIVQLAVILAVSIWLHEYAHAYVSYRLGDPTPKLQGRLTPNPLKHLDPIWFLMIFLIHFGRGKPVQINPLYYKNPRKGELMVALAGPATNLILAIVWILVMLIYVKLMGGTPNDINLNITDPMINFWVSFSVLNITLALFNLIPIAPLDGYRLIKIWRYRWAEFMERYARFWLIFIVLLIFLWGGVFSNIILSVFNFLFTIIGQVFY